MPILSMFISNQISLFRRGAAHLARYGAANLSVTVALAAAIPSPHYSLPRPFTLFSFAAIAIAFGYAMGGGTPPFCTLKTKDTEF